MGSMNKAIIIGNLGKDAELRYTPAGAAVCTFSVATTERWKNRDGVQQEKTEWHRIVVWGNAAESLAEYLTKGKSVAIEGRIETRKYQDKDGHDRYSTEIRSDRVILLGGGNGSSGAKPATQAGRQSRRDDAAPQEQSDNDPGFGGDDDIPF